MLKIVVVGVAFIYVNNMSQDGMLESQTRYVVSHPVWHTLSGDGGTYKLSHPQNVVSGQVILTWQTQVKWALLSN